MKGFQTKIESLDDGRVKIEMVKDGGTLVSIEMPATGAIAIAEAIMAVISHIERRQQ